MRSLRSLFFRHILTDGHEKDYDSFSSGTVRDTGSYQVSKTAARNSGSRLGWLFYTMAVFCKKIQNGEYCNCTERRNRRRVRQFLSFLIVDSDSEDYREQILNRGVRNEPIRSGRGEKRTLAVPAFLPKREAIDTNRRNREMTGRMASRLLAMPVFERKRNRCRPGRRKVRDILRFQSQKRRNFERKQQHRGAEGHSARRS
jgi:hypothetical protein